MCCRCNKYLKFKQYYNNFKNNHLNVYRLECRMGFLNMWNYSIEKYAEVLYNVGKIYYFNYWVKSIIKVLFVFVKKCKKVLQIWYTNNGTISDWLFITHLRPIVTYILLCTEKRETLQPQINSKGVYLSLFVWSLMVNYIIKSLFN